MVVYPPQKAIFSIISNEYTPEPDDISPFHDLAGNIKAPADDITTPAPFHDLLLPLSLLLS